MKQSIGKLVIVLALFVSVVAFSSCNRGYGCPGNNFSLEIDGYNLSDICEEGLLE